jgi:hypothetical protein
VAKRLGAAREAFLDVVDFVAGGTKASPNAVFAGSVPYLMLAGNLVAGWQLARSLLVAEDQLAPGQDAAFMRAKITTARFYADHILDQGARPARQHRGRRRQRDRAGAGSVLKLACWMRGLFDIKMIAASAYSISARGFFDHIFGKLLPCPNCPRVAEPALPVIGSPLFIISNPKLVIEQCKAGVVGSMPALNARPAEQLDEWLAEITETLAAYNKANPDKPAAPFAINQIVHKSNDRLEHDMQVCAKYKVPIIITSAWARAKT